MLLNLNMDDSTLHKSLSFLGMNELIIIFNKNNLILKKFIINLIKKYNSNPKFFSNYKLIDYINFIPLPSYLLSDNNLSEYTIKNYYIDTEDYILLGNICLPHPKISPIPFTYGYTCNKEYRLTITNTYYYEVTICNKKNNFFIKHPVISIGFSSINNIINNQQSGWQLNSLGIHSDDGKYFYNGTALKNIYSFKKNDTIGCGIIYTEYEKYIPFFTKNGKNLIILDEITLKGYITPSIGHDHNNGFKINFGNKNFKFNIKKMLKYSNNIISTKNKFITTGFNLKLYKYIRRTVLKIKKKYKYYPLKKAKLNNDNENINNLINTEMNNNNNNNNNNLLQISSQFIDNITTNLFDSNQNLSVIGNSILLPGNNNISTFEQNILDPWFQNNTIISPINTSQIQDPELPNYSDESIQTDSDETY
jgi:hypothetical protein